MFSNWNIFLLLILCLLLNFKFNFVDIAIPYTVLPKRSLVKCKILFHHSTRLPIPLYPLWFKMIYFLLDIITPLLFSLCQTPYISWFWMRLAQYNEFLISNTSRILQILGWSSLFHTQTFGSKEAFSKRCCEGGKGEIQW